MPRDPYFSFGDEELNGAPEESPPQLESGPTGPVGIAERPAGGDRAASEGAERPEARAGSGSSPRRSPVATRPRLIALLPVGLVVVLIAKALLATAGASAPSAHSSAPAPVGSRAEAPVGAVERSAAELRANRRRAAERERAQRQRAQTRRRARRHRERRRAERRQLARRRSEAPAEAPVSEAPASSYAPPSYVPPSVPAPQPAPEAQQPRGLRDGSHSPEFGL
jgi:hypothetical protein